MATAFPVYKMQESNTTPAKKGFSIDWLLRGVLTKLGDFFDRFTGRSWKPSSSLATSELVEKLKKLLDAEAQETAGKAKFVPHNIKLKMQWDKFSTDSEEALKRLENELLTAVIDHINDNRYHTYAPLKLEIKPDYFTEGVKLLASFDKFAEEEREVGVNVTVPDLKNIVLAEPEEIKVEPKGEIYIAQFTINNQPEQVELEFFDGKRVSVGRTKENDLSLDDPSVSKIHAALILNSERQLLVSDTGSTNGTFVGGERIAYGKAFPINDGEKVKFGLVEVLFNRVPNEADFAAQESLTEEADFAKSEEFAARTELLPSGKFENIKDFSTNKDVVLTEQGITSELKGDLTENKE